MGNDAQLVWGTYKPKNKSEFIRSVCAGLQVFVLG